jgi:hypothetical protein
MGLSARVRTQAIALRIVSKNGADFQKLLCLTVQMIQELMIVGYLYEDLFVRIVHGLTDYTIESSNRL